MAKPKTTPKRGMWKWTEHEWRIFLQGYQTGTRMERNDPVRRTPSPPRLDQLLRVAQVMKLTGLGRTTLWSLERRGEFPARVKRSGANSRAVAWRASDVARWIAARKPPREA